MPPLTAFVGSSSARRGIADAILENLEGEVEITCWYHDFYQPTSSVFDDLLQQIGRFDFGIFIFCAGRWRRDPSRIRRFGSRQRPFRVGTFLGTLGRLVSLSSRIRITNR